MSNLVAANGQLIQKDGACRVCALPIQYGQHVTPDECLQTMKVYTAQLAEMMMAQESQLNAVSQTLLSCQLFAVTSSNIRAIGFSALNVGQSPAVGSIGVLFKNGRFYASRREDVPVAVFGKFLASESKGKFYNEQLKPFYDFAEIKAPSPANN